MLKKLLVLLAMLYAAACFAAVDANKATAAELDAVKGIGPSLSSKILDERKKGNFKNWDDLVTRVKGVGENNAVKLSAEGLTVDGATYKGAVAAAKKESKATAKVAEKKADATPAAVVAPAASEAVVKGKAKAKAAKAAASASK